MIRTILLTGLFFCCAFLKAQTNNTIWFNEPAEVFEEAFPLGNGRIGAMLYGRTDVERISLNESTLWAGSPVNPNMNPQAHTYLPKVREALFNEDYRAADSLMHFMQGKFSESYAPLGNLSIRFGHKEVTDYRRTLDISNATSTIQYNYHNTAFSREVFISHPHRVMVIKLSAKGQLKLNFTVGFNSLLPNKSMVTGSQILFWGHAPSHAEPNYRGNMPDAVQFDVSKSMQFGGYGKIAATDGVVDGDFTSLSVGGASYAVLILSLATNFNGFDQPFSKADPAEELSYAAVKTASALGYEELRKQHIEDYQHFFNRVHINLGTTGANSALAINERLKKFATNSPDPELVALYFQFGRYLLISSSRTAGVPINLQGIWNEEMRPPWSSNYTTNINTEMNYWSVETTNLSELHQPLLDFIPNLEKTGTITARNYYNARGWALHHNTDIWAMTNPVGDFGKGDPVWANWMMGSPWISTHIWEHYSFTRDEEFLRKNYYLLKGAAEFCIDFLTKDKQGRWVTAPATSPENKYISATGYHGATLFGGTADLAMIKELFYALVESSKILKTDESFRAEVEKVLSQLHPYQVGKKGHLQEWYYDWEDEDPQHRHISHLFGAYPGRSISFNNNPELVNAVKRSLELRTNNGTGWSIAWKINLWARLRNADMAYDAVKKILAYYPGRKGEIKYGGGGTYPNLFDAHPPFQIDGNFGATAGIAEMLLQSHEGEINLLPALPKEWATGTVSGLRARGAYTVDIQWKGAKLIQAGITPDFDGAFSVRYKNKVWKLNGKKGIRLTVK